jgi:ABC toxin-like protein/neuraminidase-like protein/putative peptidoglycan binding protein/virulence plasmid A protein
MKAVIFPLKLRMKGPEVADLQAALQLALDRGVLPRDDNPPRQVLSAALQREAVESRYGPATRRVVSFFQALRQLGTTGEVDQATAAALNALLREWGLLDHPAAPRSYMVSGEIRREDGLPSQGVRVRAVHESARGAIRLGEDMTDAEGRYTIRYELLPGLESVALRIVASDETGSQVAASDVIASARPLEKVDLLVPAVDGAQYVVEGRVTSRVRAGVGGLRVVIVDKGVGGDIDLVEASTDDRGRYRAAFTGAALRQRGKKRPDVQARIFAGDRFLGASEVRYDAASHETLDVFLDEKHSAALRSEHETLTGALAVHAGGGLGGLQERDGRQDITYLANKTGWDARAVALAALAEQFSARTVRPDDPGLEAPLFYAMFRAGLPANESALYRTDAATIHALWTKAMAQGVIAPVPDAEIKTALERFQKLAAERALAAPALAGVSSLRELLSMSLATPTQHERFAQLYTRHRRDMPKFWQAVTDALGEPAAQRLRLDGQLAYLTLNNAPLIRKLHTAAGPNGLAEAAQLVDEGYYHADRWQAAVANDTVPGEIPGASDQERRQRYADVLAAQVRLSFPTRVVAQMVKAGETPVRADTASDVHDFLVKNEGKFEIGMQPVAQYVGRNTLQVAPAVLQEVTRIQRVYQITPGDTAMNALLQDGVDSAFAVTRYDREEFVRKFGKRVGGETSARLIHAKSQQVHNVVLNIALSYLTAANAPGVGVHSPPQIINPAPGPNPNATDVIAYSTLEDLFGSMDYCVCDHCRSFLSPAAYLVDLLLFCDRPENELENPLTVLLERRPDLQHLPLTCENTNTPLPYIDVVNETLEYYITNGLSLADYEGHTFDGSASPEELLANPQFVTDAAYTTLAGKPLAPADPPPLLPPTPPMPFHQPLEKLRRYLGKFDASLSSVMEVMRATDDLERPAPADPAHPVEYGWRDILMEELRLSRAEHDLITDRTRTLQHLYGYSAGTTQAQVLASLSNAKAFAARMAVSYVDLVEILRTRFINPGSSLLPRLERLGVSFATIKAFKDGAITGAEFDDALAPQVEPAAYGGNIQAWVTNQANYDAIMGLILLTDPTGADQEGTFDTLEFRYANPDMTANRLRAFEFVRLYRFIRLWRKLGWTIDQTDRAITALYPAAQAPNDADDAVNLQRLDTGFLTMLPRLAVLRRVMAAVNLKPSKELPSLLACFAPIDTHGEASLYRQMFLSPAWLDQDAAFADDGFGNVLTAPGEMLLAHAAALRAAFSLTDEELTLIAEALGFNETTPLTLANISAVFRRGWLARKLKLSVRELLALTRFTGIDPFAAPDPVDPPILRFLDLVSRLRALSLKPAQALYLVWNEDMSGGSAPRDEDMNAFARTLRADLAAIAREFAATEDPDGQVAPARMALVYDHEATDLFFGLLGQSVVTDVAYDHGQPALQQEILDAAQGRLAYDNLRKRLAYTGGVMPNTTQGALTGLGIATPEFKAAVKALHEKTRAFFVRYPELEPLHDAFIASTETPEQKRAALLAALLPQLEEQRKRQHALQALSAAVEIDVEVVTALAGNAAVLHATGAATRPALDDVRAVETGGLSARWFFGDKATGPDGPAPSDAVGTLAYAADGQTLPKNPAPGEAISGIWSGYLEAPENGFYNLRIDTDAGATVTLSLDGAAVPLGQNGTQWSNAAPIELRAGTLYAIALTVERVTTAMTVRWETLGRGWEVIPAELLYPGTLMDRLRHVYVRLRKAATLAAALKLSAAETAYLASHADYRIAGDGWLNALPVTADSTPEMAAGLFTAASTLLEYARLKDALKGTEDRLLAVLQDPVAAAQPADGLLFTLTRWEPDSLDALLIRFGHAQGPNADRGALADLAVFARVFDAYAWVKKLRIPAAALIAAATNEPDAARARDFQGALRARYEERDWFETLRPINDEMRALQRDALVAYVLHHMRATPATAHIDTPEKLFEYFLMDVQMEPCWQTSRIRHALSSAQSFIERCLMNLEPRVAAKSINATQWEWMRRYRVWEANRKVFLFPENWLEPELRDDKSVFFTETMSELLQSDITEDAAAAALINYLTKLEEVAKLEPCGIHYAGYDASKGEDDIAHVVARTAGARRKYFYRRREYGYWTPWEPVNLDIEDDPVLPVLWKNRLFLFWLKIIQQAPLETPTELSGDLSKLDAGATINPNSRISVKAMLCWSEYVNGKWQPAKTSDPSQPAHLDSFKASGSGAFKRSELRLRVVVMGATLAIEIAGQGGATFTLYNTHSLPEPGGLLSLPAPTGPTRVLDTAGSTLAATYHRGIVSVPFGETPPESTLPRPILTTGVRDRVVEPRHPLHDSWHAPFFYEDKRHVFYVTTRQRFVRVPKWEGFEFDIPAVEELWEFPPLVWEILPVPDPIGPLVNPPDFGIVDRVAMTRFVTEDAYIHRGLATSQPVQFDGSLIGPGGQIASQTEL